MFLVITLIIVFAWLNYDILCLNCCWSISKPF